MSKRIVFLWLLAFGGFYTIKHMKENRAENQETNKIVKRVAKESEHTKEEKKFCARQYAEMVSPPYKYGDETCK